ncbi:exopolyphosphatase [Permianibacter sp. IMCC34836]|uniref:exopolyphosphatase n=1 Tax=Permianibacter fluminis TaxID=2738515 RepID=UPI001554A538|nr:exopolyphosphatase [Permianibacter fluminis]NQD35710.1 exopolyphosphatase [Permianibacter fluminis]
MPRSSLKDDPPRFDVVAAVDLGSNSFHMSVARVVDGGLQTIGRIKERVQLAAGLYDGKQLSEDAIQRGVDCLKVFGQRLHGMHPEAVRAVGTNTLRLAKNAPEFLQRAEEVLGFPIEVIAGKEEARLIYAGVAHTRADKERRLVIDIGGGSTEIIIGTGFNAQLLDSLQMGCVSFERKFFPGGELSKAKFKAAQTQCYLELQTIEQRYRKLGWQLAIGSSGTIISIAEILRSRHDDEYITLSRLHALRDEILEAGSVERIKLPGLSDDRRAIFAPGLAILLSCFEILGIEKMQATEAALREGLLYELVGRFSHLDVRERSIYGLVHRHQLDREQAERVRDTALSLYKQVASDWHLDEPELQALFGWAAIVHEIGLMISYGQMHKHGAYVLTHSDIDGFSQQEKQLLALLVRAHRRKFPDEEFASVPKYWRVKARRLARLLRLAALLHHRRTDEPLPKIKLDVEREILRLQFPKGWLDTHTLMRADLEQEKIYSDEAKLPFEFG